MRGLLLSLWCKRLACILALSFVFMAGCASSTLTLDFIAIEPVNETQTETGTDGDSRVVDVRVYQLKDDAKFNDASVEAVWSDAEETLGDSLINIKLGESIFPEKPDGPRNGKEIILDPLSEQTRFIGVLALFGPSDDGPRKVAVPVDRAGSVLFELTGYHIKVKDR